MPDLQQRVSQSNQEELELAQELEAGGDYEQGQSFINHPDIEIITKFNAEIRGLYNYYRLANNVSVLSKFAYIMEYSMYKTFACKYRSTVSKIIDRYSHNGVFSVPYQTRAGKKYYEFYHDGFKRVKEVMYRVDTLRKHVEEHLDEADLAYVAQYVGFLDCEVDRIVPPFRREGAGRARHDRRHCGASF